MKIELNKYHIFSLIRIFIFVFKKNKNLRRISYLVFCLIIVLSFGECLFFLLWRDFSSYFLIQSKDIVSQRYTHLILIPLLILWPLRIFSIFINLKFSSIFTSTLNKTILRSFNIFSFREVNISGPKEVAHLLTVESDEYYQGIVFPFLQIITFSFSTLILFVSYSFFYPLPSLLILIIICFVFIFIYFFVLPLLKKISRLAAIGKSKSFVDKSNFIDSLDTIKTHKNSNSLINFIFRNDIEYKRNLNIGFLIGTAPKILIEFFFYFLIIISYVINPNILQLLFNSELALFGSSLYYIQRLLANGILISIAFISFSASIGLTSQFNELIKNVLKKLNTNQNIFRTNDLNSYISKNWSLIKFKKVKFNVSKDKLINIGTFDIKRDKWIGLSAPSGLGKTTLLKLLIGLEKPHNGEVNIIVDKSSNNKYPARVGLINIGVAFQNPYFFFNSLVENICSKSLTEINDADKIFANKILKIITLDYLLNNFDLDTNLGESVLNLSGGEKLRLSIGRALYLNPSLLILDEPTAALDRTTSKKLLSNIKNSDICSSVIIISHKKEDLDFCDEVLYKKNFLSSFENL